MKYLLTILLLPLISYLYSQETYHKAKIYYNTPKDLVLLANQGVAIDHVIHKKGVFIESDFSQNEINLAKGLGLDVELVIENVSEFYSHQNKLKNSEKNENCNNPINYPVPSNYNNGSMGGFLTYSEMLQELDDMASLYPNLITVKQSISNFSTEENRPIYWVRMSDNPNNDENEPEMLYTAIHHAREPGSLQQTIFYMWYLLENYSTNEEVQAILNNTELYFIPCINPDGYIYNEITNPNGGGLWRKNRRDNGDGNFGVDLNRNYSYQWGGAGTSTDTDSDIYLGPSAFSEVETQAIKWFCEQHDFKMALNSHTYGNLLLYPFGYATGQISPDDATFVAMSEVMVEQNGYTNQISAALYAASGDSDDWMYAETSTHNEILAMTPEVGNGFWPSENSIISICQNMVYHNLMAANFITNYAKSYDQSPFSITQNTGYFNYTIKRLGLDAPGNFTVSITPITNNIVSVGSPKSHNGMALLQTDTDSIAYTLAASIQTGDEIRYVLTTNNGLYDTKDTITKYYGTLQPLLVENGDNTSNWLNTGDWGINSQHYYTPSSSITDSPNGNYDNNSNTSIRLADDFSLSNAIVANISFYARWEIEEDWDYVQFEISTDGGNTWIPQCGKYTNSGSDDQATGEPLYDGMQNAWVKEEINLSEYLGQNISARFQLVTDQAVKEDGFYFDDFQINVIYGSNIAEHSNQSVYISQNVPNPSNGTTSIYYQLGENYANTALILFNQVGKQIRKYPIANSKGQVTINTNELAAGVYFYHLTNNGTSSETYKMMVVK
ncbi:MAG: M14 family zinc carboxypeptidase [Flavobacteriales bacterium]|jgi:hypothetical protein|nr:M14 family zinc carboxypeptidase [Flavobacteriales bacterium]